jgi:hypothetical protein
MNKNIRRSLVIAAGFSGAWALGSAVASAEEPPAPPVSVPDRAVDVAQDAGAVRVDVQHAADQGTHLIADQGTRLIDSHRMHPLGHQETHPGEAARGPAAQEMPGAVHHATHAVHGVAEHGVQAAHGVHGGTDHAAHAAQGVPGDATHAARGVMGHPMQMAAGSVADSTGAAHGATGHAGGAAQDVVAMAGKPGNAAHEGATHTAGVAHGDVDYLFGPLSAFAPELESMHPGPVPAPAQPVGGASDQTRPVEAAPVQVQTLRQALDGQIGQQAGQTAQQASQPTGRRADQALGQLSGGDRQMSAGEPRTFAAEAMPAGGLTQAVPVALQAVGDAMYIGQGIQGDVLAGRLPDDVPADTARFADHLLSGISEVTGGLTPAQPEGI